MPRTTDSILNAIETAVANKEIWSPGTWLECAQDLIALSSNETDRVAELQQQVARKKLEIMEQGKTAAYAKIAIEASDEYLYLQKQKAKVERIMETVRISKYQARLQDEAYRQ